MAIVSPVNGDYTHLVYGQHLLLRTSKRRPPIKSWWSPRFLIFLCLFWGRQTPPHIRLIYLSDWAKNNRSCKRQAYTTNEWQNSNIKKKGLAQFISSY